MQVDKSLLFFTMHAKVRTNSYTHTLSSDQPQDLYLLTPRLCLEASY